MNDREIMFRVWCLDNKCFLDPNGNSPGGRLQPWCLLSFYGEVISGADNMGAFVDSDQSNYVIQQYTGLRDRNGIKIYEGDIVFHKSFSICHFYGRTVTQNFFIKFVLRDNNLEYCLTYRDPKDHSIYNIWTGNEVEIIGNIFENPELLKEKNEKDN